MQGYDISALAASKKLTGLRLVAGAQGEFNRIRNVNIIDNLDSYDWLKAGDFLLTTGYIYKDDQAQLVGMVERLAQINCAGLGFKIKRYFDTLPREMLRRADELGLPVLEIPLKYSLADVSNEISDNLHNVDDSYLTQYLSIHNSFNECVLSGGGAKALTDTLYGALKMPVVLVDSRWRVLTYSDPEGEISELTPKNMVFPKEFLESIANKLVGGSKIITRTYSSGEISHTVRIAQLDDATSIYGFLLIFETKHKADWLDFVAIETATVPLVLERIKAKQISEVKHQLRQDFFDDLLMGRIDSINAASNLAEIHNMDINKIYMCMVIKLNENIKPGEESEEERNNFLKIKNEIIYIINRCAAKQDVSVMAIHRSDLVISFIHVAENKLHMHTWEILEGLPEDIVEEIRKSSNIGLSVGVGTPITDFLNLKASYFQANEAIHHLRGDTQVAYYENFMVDQLLSGVTDRQALESFVQLSLGALIEYDDEHGTNLVQTLEIYFECNSNVSLASKKLFLHRNSLIYRMDRIKDVLNSDLKSPSELLTLQVGLRVLKILEARQ